MSKFYLGIDLGGTNTKIGIGAVGEKLLKADSIHTHVELGPQAWVQRVADLVKSWNLPFDAVGVGSPGPLNTNTGTILTTPNLKSFQGFEMRPAFEAALGHHCTFENDANAAALGEFYYGPHKKLANLAVITLGTGVGSGIISNGKLIRGAQGFATELGHMVIDCNGPKCLCGKNGCLEAFVGARATINRYLKLIGEENASIHMREIFARAFSNEQGREFIEARGVFSQWIEALAVGLANTITLFNPALIILSGGITEGWDNIKPRLLEALRPMVESYILDSTKIEISGLGTYFGVYGAIAVAAEK